MELKVKAVERKLKSIKQRVYSFGKRLFLSLVVFASALPAWSAGEVYPVMVPTKYPKSYAAYKKIIPAKWKNAAWVYRLQGTAGPVRTIDFSGKKFVLGTVCKPHDCGGNQLTFLVAVDGSAAFALANSFDLTQTKDVIVGKPDPEAMKILAKGLD